MAGLARTPLYELHLALGAKMVEFAGYEMPVSYPMGVLGEHLHCRVHAGLFDVSHMGQGVTRDGAALERLMPVDVLGLKVGRQRYGLLTAEDGGILDDLMFVNRGADYFMVVNGACKGADFAHLGAEMAFAPITDRGLLALQGPEAEQALARHLPEVAAMKFMDFKALRWRGAELWVTRSGYTGEDGFEISLPEELAVAFAEVLLAEPEVAPIGLGARDSLRLEAGLPLYGHDIDRDISPVEAGLAWAIGARRRAEGGFAGGERILQELAEGPARLRVGLLPEGRAPMREGVEIVAEEGRVLGRITSGGFSPSLGRPVAMALLPRDCPEPMFGALRGKLIPVQRSALPFHPTRYKR